ncbi:hypothetical protein OEB99_02135 [Actinotalea sp. M2MS4P-6]|uniref:hypothetical protein n=1 Tax=Actinotalea sp. M2MS4P-6 TaxID=2983762 RepID=UPI0021E40416|nr:hypothetical protein [Actinotalea sp. M2MS4P-6]MCV2393097.1 hypothetical protein [Actinotalea sp. M2MS4P-6]
MSPHDDDQSVIDARDEAVIAGQAVAPEDAALAQWAAELRASAVAPEPSAALADLLEHGAGLRVVGAPPRRRHRVAQVAVGSAVAAAMLVGGTAAAAAVRDGVPVTELPHAITQRIGDAVGDVLVAVGVREPADEATATDPAASVVGDPSGDPTDDDATVGVPPGHGVADQAPGRTDDPAQQAPGLDEDGPGASEDAPGHDENGPGASEDAPGLGGTNPGLGDEQGNGNGSSSGDGGDGPGQSSDDHGSSTGTDDTTTGTGTSGSGARSGG